MLNKLIPSFQSNSKIIDHIHEEQLILKKEIKKTSLTNYKDNKVVRIKTK